MSNSAELTEAVTRLRSADLEQRLRALEELRNAVAADAVPSSRTLDEWQSSVSMAATAAVEAFRDEREARFAIWERLVLLGPCTVPPLESLLASSPDSDTRVLAAAGLLRNGSQSGVDTLLKAVDPSSDWMCLAVRVLTLHGIAGTGTLIVEALSTTPITDTDQLACLLEGLRTLGLPMPDDIRLRIAQVEPSWLREGLLSITD